jgi:hypothetical protein
MIFYFLKKKKTCTIAITHLKDPKILISYSVGKEISLSHNTAFEMTPWNKHIMDGRISNLLEKLLNGIPSAWKGRKQSLQFLA